MMHRLLLDLADFSAIEMRRLTVTRVLQSLDDVLTSARDLFESRADAVGVQLEFANVSGLPSARFDATRVLQVVSNLLDNALKFTPVGGTVRVDARADVREVIVSVVDNGSGVAPDELPHVFERFWRAPAKRGGRGLGLGLAIVQGVIAAHGGRVWMESTPGRGSSVSFTLPR
jgi:signal transduction histidine kinase